MTDLLKDYDIQHSIDVINEECPEFFWNKAVFTRRSQIKGASKRLEKALDNVFKFQHRVTPKRTGTALTARRRDLSVTIKAVPYEEMAKKIERCYAQNMTKTQAARLLEVPITVITNLTNRSSSLSKLYKDMSYLRNHASAMRHYYEKVSNENHV